MDTTGGDPRRRHSTAHPDGLDSAGRGDGARSAATPGASSPGDFFARRRREGNQDWEPGPFPPVVSPRGLVIVAACVLAADLVVLATIATRGTWHPLWLLFLLSGFCVLSEVFGSPRFAGAFLSNTYLALVMTAALLGPLPAAVVGVGAACTDAVAYRKPPRAALFNATMYVTLTTVASLVFLSIPVDRRGAAVAFVGAGAAILNATMLAAARRIERGLPFWETLKALVMPVAPFLVVSSTLAAAATEAFITDELVLFGGLMFVLLGSEVILRNVVASQARAIEVARLTRERAELLEQALETEEAERAWLASHLHDHTLQLVAAAQQDLAEDAIEDASQRLAEITKELRHTLIHFHPASIAEIGLEAALTAYAAQLTRRGKARFFVAVDDAVVGETDAPLLYSLGRELLTNAAKHARASRIELAVERKAGSVQLTVADDGVGFDSAAPVRPGHVGLAAARRRVHAHGGQLRVFSTPGEGTRVTIELPMSATDEGVDEHRASD
jgi:signal transduction histidine kinase